MWPCYRLIREGWATLAELDADGLTIDDVDLACLVLDEFEAAQARLRRRAR